MNILVVGGAGYIGSVLCRQLLERGYQVRVLDSLLFGGESLLGFFAHPKFEFCYGDIRSEKDVTRSLRGVDAVVNLAAIVGEHLCQQNPKIARDTNYRAACNLANKARARKIKRFIFVSTCSNYGINEEGKGATEETILRPISLYSRTKVKAEEFILRLPNNDFAPTILRLSTIFGLSPRMRFDLLVSELVKEAYLYGKLSIYKPDAWRPLVHVEDAAKAIVAVIETPLNKIKGEIFNVGYGNYQKRDLVRIIQKELPHMTVNNLEGQGDNRDYKVSFAKIEKVLGVKATLSVEEGVRQLIKLLSWGVFPDLTDRRLINAKN